MTIEAITGPLIVFQDGSAFPGAPTNANPDQGPSLFLQGTGVLDPRFGYTYSPDQGPTKPAVGFYSTSDLLLADYAPSTVSTTNISASAALSSTTLTLVSSTGSGITVGDSITNIVTGATDSSLLRIDNTPKTITFGTSGAVAVHDPANPFVGRAVSLTSVSNLSAINFTITGYDAYGYLQTQTIAGPNNNTVNTTKTFKWIKSVKSSTTNAGSVSVGTADIYGLPIRADRFFYVSDSAWANALVLTAQFTAADTTSPATASTGDVRGTITPASSSDGTKRLQLAISLHPANISTVTGLLGVTPA